MYSEGRKNLQKSICHNIFSLNEIKVITWIQNNYLKNI